MRLVPLIVAATASSACAVSPRQQARAERNEAAATLSADGQSYGDGARVTGPARSCVPLIELGNSRVLSDRVIDFERPGRGAYRVVLPQSCPQLGFEQRFSYATSLNQLCRQDIITVLIQSPGLQRGASCGLADFRPITPAPRSR